MYSNPSFVDLLAKIGSSSTIGFRRPHININDGHEKYRTGSGNPAAQRPPPGGMEREQGRGRGRKHKATYGEVLRQRGEYTATTSVLPGKKHQNI